MLVQHVAPATIADLRRALGGGDDVAEHHGGEHAAVARPGGERARRVADGGSDQLPRHAGREQHVTSRDGTHALEERVRLRVLYEEPARAEPERLEHVLVDVERREDEDPRPIQMVVLHDPPRRLEPVHLRHPDVHQHDVGYEVRGHAHRDVTVVRLSHDLDIGLRFEQRAEPRPNEHLVIGEQDADHAELSTGIAAWTRNPPERGPASSPPPSADTRSRIPWMPRPPEG